MLAHVVAVFLIGGFVAYTELMGRYRDAPLAVISNWLCGVYALINGLVSVLALYLIKVSGFITPTSSSWSDVQIVLLAGVSGLAFLRSSLFSVKTAGGDIAIGPAAAIQVLQKALDGTYDRQRGQARMQAVADIMKDVSFDLAAEALPAACFSALQNISTDDQQAVDSQIKDIQSSNIKDNRTKSLYLGLILLDVCGEDLLRRTVAVLGQSIEEPNLLPIDGQAALYQLAQVPNAAELLVAVCQQMSPGVPPEQIGRAVAALTVPPFDTANTDLRLQLLAQALLTFYSQNTVTDALNVIIANEGVLPPAAASIAAAAQPANPAAAETG